MEDLQKCLYVIFNKKKFKTSDKCSFAKKRFRFLENILHAVYTFEYIFILIFLHD